MATVARPTSTGMPGYSETMPCEPASAKRARLLVSAALSCWGIHDLVDDGTLIVEELMANAIDHTRSRMARVVVRRLAEHRVRIGVADTSRDVPDMRKPCDDAEDGRGLLLVDALSDRWGYDRCGTDKRGWKLVWAELPLEGKR